MGRPRSKAIGGFIATVVRDIARGTECDPGSVTFHFADKAAIFDAALPRRAEETSADLSSAILGSDT